MITMIPMINDRAPEETKTKCICLLIMLVMVMVVRILMINDRGSSLNHRDNEQSALVSRERSFNHPCLSLLPFDIALQW